LRSCKLEVKTWKRKNIDKSRGNLDALATDVAFCEIFFAHGLSRSILLVEMKRLYLISRWLSGVAKLDFLMSLSEEAIDADSGEYGHMPDTEPAHIVYLFENLLLDV
jgi:hypothetical protein